MLKSNHWTGHTRLASRNSTTQSILKNSSNSRAWVYADVASIINTAEQHDAFAPTGSVRSVENTEPTCKTLLNYRPMLAAKSNFIFRAFETAKPSALAPLE